MNQTSQTRLAGEARPWRRRSLLLGGLGLLLVGIMAIERLAFLSHAAPSDFDDAYTYLRYAQHWLAGDGIVWNTGEATVFGVTSLLHLAVVTAIRRGFPALPMWHVLQVASGAAAIGLLAALVAIAALVARDPRLSRNWIFWAGMLLPLVAFREAFGFHAGTGMDTMLAALSNAVLIFFSLQLGAKPTTGRIALAVAAGAVSVLARPDNLICAVLCPTLAILLLAERPIVRPLVLHGSMSVLVLGLLALGAWHLLGTPVPLSFFVKQPGYYSGFAGEFGWNPFRFLDVFLIAAWPFVVAVILFGDRAGWRSAVVLLAPALSTVAALFRFNQIMGHLGRFYFPMLPFFVVAGLLQFDRFVSRPRHALRPKVLLARAAVAFVVVAVVRAGLGSAGERYASRSDAQTLPPIVGYQVAAAESLPEVDSWESARRIAAIAAAAPAGARFDMSEHGLPGALAPNIAIVDVLGLHDADFALHGFSAAEFFRRGADFIWMPHSDHAFMLKEILASDEFWAHYAFYPDAFFHGVAVRTDGKHAAALGHLLSSAWDWTYPGIAMADHRAARSDIGR